ncbi:hypothetical protein [Actinoplanes auranticolor]|nr:hypothetical protein [Actinoplanes auranticolor]
MIAASCAAGAARAAKVGFGRDRFLGRRDARTAPALVTSRPAAAR